MLSPQLRAMSPEIQLLAVFIDAVAAYCHYCAQVQARVDTAALAFSDRAEGWNTSKAERLMASRGWGSADDIFNEAGIPDKHRQVISLALWGDPTKHKQRMFTTKEIAEMTGHPERTVMRWLSDDMPKLWVLARVA